MLSLVLSLLTLTLTLPTDSAIHTLDEMYRLQCTYNKTFSNINENTDIVIGALFPIHHYQHFRKKYVININAIAWVESFLYAINEINQNAKLLPGVQLGYVVKDTCNEEELALRQALSFMVDTKYFRNDTQGKGDTPSQRETICQCSQNKRNVIASSIGCDLSSVSRRVAMLTNTDHIPQISPFSVNPTLSDIQNFLRTLPTDIFQTTAIADLLRHFNWTYVSVLASDNDYGRFAKNNLQGKLKERGICSAVDKLFDPRINSDAMKKLIAELKAKYHKSNVVILWCDVSDAINIITEAYKAGLHNITWIGTEMWGRQRELRKISCGDHGEYKNLRLITLSMKDEIVDGFKSHWDNITYYSSLNNPWFPELWDQLRRCRPNTTEPAGCMPACRPGSWLPTGCVPAQWLPSITSIPILQHEYVMYAVYAVAHGLHTYLNCTENKCNTMKKSLDYKELLKHIKNVSFTLPTSKLTFRFNEKGEKTSTSYIYYIRKFNNRVRKGKCVESLVHLPLGKWIDTDSPAQIDNTILEDTWGLPNASRPVATCSLQCPPGTRRVNSSNACCWSCPSCANNEISTEPDQATCQKCYATKMSNINRTLCISKRDISLRVTDAIGIVLIAISLLGIIGIIWIIWVYRQHWDSPVVKSSSREISVLQLLLMLILFCLPALDFVEVSPTVCYAKTSIFGVVYSQVMALIVMKTYRLFCVFNTNTTHISKLLKNKYQTFFSFVLVTPQILQIVIWFSLNKVTIKVETPPERVDTFIKYCGHSNDNSIDILIILMVSHIILLSIAGAYMAFRARKLPENYKETLTIFYAMFVNILLWLPISSLVYFLNEGKDRKRVAFLMINLVGTFSLLGILYGSKLIIILLYPELNNKEHFRQMAATNTMLTFLKDVDPQNFGQKRVSQQIVLEYDFDAMFKEYKEKQTTNLPEPKITLKSTIKRIKTKRNSSPKIRAVSPLRERKFGTNLDTLENINNAVDKEEISEDNDNNKEIESVQINTNNNNNHKQELNEVMSELPRSPSLIITENRPPSSSSSKSSSPSIISYDNAAYNRSPSPSRKMRPPSPLCRADNSNPSSPSYTIGNNVVIHNVVNKSPTHSNCSQTLEIPTTSSYNGNNFVDDRKNSTNEEGYLSRDNSIISLIRKEQKPINNTMPPNVFEFPQTYETEKKNDTIVTNKTIVTDL